jgi:hypothetical protein
VRIDTIGGVASPIGFGVGEGVGVGVGVGVGEGLTEPRVATKYVGKRE